MLRSIKESGVLEPGLLLNISGLLPIPESPRFFSEYDELLFFPLSQSSVFSLMNRWESALSWDGSGSEVSHLFFSIFLFVCLFVVDFKHRPLTFLLDRSLSPLALWRWLLSLQ